MSVYSGIVRQSASQLHKDYCTALCRIQQRSIRA